VSWGTPTQARASNMDGDELKVGFAFDGRMSLLARLFVAEAITTVEDGMRFRVDINYEF